MDLSKVHQQPVAGGDLLDHAEPHRKGCRHLAPFGFGKTDEECAGLDMMFGKRMVKPGGRQNPQLQGCVCSRL